MNKLEISISSKISDIVLVESFIESFVSHFQLSEELYGKVSLSVIEAVNNAIMSGNKQNPDKSVVVTAAKFEDKFQVTITDEGEGFDYNYIPDPTLSDNLEKDAGRGLFLMKILSDELIFEKGGSKVTLVFKV